MTPNEIGKKERETQNRIVKLLQSELDYEYLGNWEEAYRIQPIEESILLDFLMNKQGYSQNLAEKAVDELVRTATSLPNGLYEANKNCYSLLRYGIPVRESLGEVKETVWLIDWKHPENNHFSFAEEVTFIGKHTKRPDLVFYVNGIAVGVLELKRSKVGVSKGIHQNLFNQKADAIPKLFTTMQLVLAGNDSVGLRYGTIKTPEKYYLQWKEASEKEFDYSLDLHLTQMLNKKRLLELIHDFVIFDKGTKKLCRPNQYFGIQAAKENVRQGKGGIIWHTQGSGKSLTMVWLTKWIRENITNSRVLIITDREELDDQIEKLYLGVEEQIQRAKNGRDLLRLLDGSSPWLMCTLVHKFGRHAAVGDYEGFIEDIEQNIPSDFNPQGELFVFVDECHRTQSGKLHKAMKRFLPEATFIGYTGTPLLKKDKEKSIEVFGPYIGQPYKFDEAVEDGVVLDLLYEARDVAQFVTDQQSIDEWFEMETKGLTDTAKTELKKRWGTMQKVLGSQSRLEKIVFDIIKDFRVKPRLATGEGNAMLVSGSIYQACKYYELFQRLGFTKCAIITSYDPHFSDIKDEETGEEAPTEKLLKYEVYQKMLNGQSVEAFEERVKTQFIDEPSQMKLLIVVDKLLTGFDAPSATYLYIDKSMQDHGLFQAICRVNRVDDDSKTYGYIIDYKDLFRSLEKSIKDYTSGAFDEYDADDVEGLLTNRHEAIKEDLETALEAVRSIIEPVHPKDEPNFIRYFCGNTQYPDDLKEREEKRVTLYKAVVRLIRAYAETASEMDVLGYTEEEASSIKEEVKYFTDLRDTIKQASGDAVDFKQYEAGMRQLMDMYIDANSSKKISNFENKSLVDLIINIGEDPRAEYEKPRSKEAVAETIENNVRKVIIEESQTNPKYYEKMSKLLDELIEQRKKETVAYQEYLKKIKALASKLSDSGSSGEYPEKLDTRAKRALYDNLDKNEVLAIALDAVIHANKLDDWRDGGLRERRLKIAVNKLVDDEEKTAELMEIIKAQSEY